MIDVIVDELCEFFSTTRIALAKPLTYADSRGARQYCNDTEMI